jgi:hypothetical protein
MGTTNQLGTLTTIINGAIQTQNTTATPLPSETWE